MCHSFTKEYNKKKYIYVNLHRLFYKLINVVPTFIQPLSHFLSFLNVPFNHVVLRKIMTKKAQ